MENELLSVIIPVYNTESFIEKCIKSICEQEYSALEIIIVNDGSTDSSLRICEDIQLIDNRIRIIRQENMGLLKARKRGISEAKGKFIAFVDSDDWIDSDLFKKLMFIENRYNVDLISSGLLNEWTDKFYEIKNQFKEGLYTRKDIEQKILPNMMLKKETLEQGVVASVCGKIFRKSLLDSIMKHINTKITYGEDGCIVYPYIAIANNIYISHESGYHYIQHNDSMIHSYTAEAFAQIAMLKNYMFETLKELTGGKDMEDQITSYVSGFLIPCFSTVFGYDFTNQTWIVPFSQTIKHKRIVIFGAGRVGKSYYKVIKALAYSDIIGWIDNNFEGKIDGMNILSRENLKNMQYDYILIAIEQKNIANEIITCLLDDDIPANKILWEVPLKFYV